MIISIPVDLSEYERSLDDCIAKIKRAIEAAQALTQPKKDAFDFALEIGAALAKGQWKTYELANRIEMYVEARMAASQPHPEAREDAYEIGTPREFAERLAWMAVNGKPDLDQWENHIKFRDAALSRLAAKEGQGDNGRSCSTCGHATGATGCGPEEAYWACFEPGRKSWIPRTATPATSEKPEEGKR